VKRLLLSSVAVAAMPAVAAGHDRDHVPGCQTVSCDKRVGRKWAERHPALARTASLRAVIAPYRAWLGRVGECEDNDDPAAGPTGYRSNTGNGFFGRYQFTLSSWAAVGGSGRPDLAPPLEQDYRAVRLLQMQGPGAWPVCSR
jgi:hypothetical protein